MNKQRHNVCLTPATADTVARIAVVEARSFSSTLELLVKLGHGVYTANKAACETPAKMDEVRA